MAPNGPNMDPTAQPAAPPTTAAPSLADSDGGMYGRAGDDVGGGAGLDFRFERRNFLDCLAGEVAGGVDGEAE